MHMRLCKCSSNQFSNSVCSLVLTSEKLDARPGMARRSPDRSVETVIETATACIKLEPVADGGSVVKVESTYKLMPGVEKAKYEVAKAKESVTAIFKAARGVPHCQPGRLQLNQLSCVLSSQSNKAAPASNYVATR